MATTWTATGASASPGADSAGACPPPTTTASTAMVVTTHGTTSAISITTHGTARKPMAVRGGAVGTAANQLQFGW